MKVKRISMLVAALLAGLCVGYFRFKLFEEYYDAYIGVIAGEASRVSMIMNLSVISISLIFAFISYKIFKKHMIKKGDFSPLPRASIFAGGALLLISGYLAFMTRSSEFFELAFSLSTAFAFVSIFVMIKNFDSTGKLFSCAHIFPAAFILLYLYRNNIKYPNISLFAYEIIAVLFIMLSFYYIASSYFKTTPASYFMGSATLAVFFSASSSVTNIMVKNASLFETILPNYAEIYFASSLLIILAFCFNLKSLVLDKITPAYGGGFFIENDGNIIAVDVNLENSASEISENLPVFYSKKVLTPDNEELVSFAYAEFAENTSASPFLADMPVTIDYFNVDPYALKESDILHRGFLISTPNKRNVLYMAIDEPSVIPRRVLKNFNENYDIDFVVFSVTAETNRTISSVCSVLKPDNVIILSPEEYDVSALGDNMKKYTVFCKEGESIEIN